MSTPVKPPRFAEPIFVARPRLPPLQKYADKLAQVWASGWLANNGAQHQQLEAALATHLGAQHLSLFNNGTIALLLACRALRLSGEVITTPFTFPASSHVLQWNGITPVFADVDPDTLTIDPQAIEQLVTDQTTGILGVHVYGIPCDVHRIDRTARYFGLKVVYDAAHAFGTTVDGTPIAQFGDATMYSFHATKLFHSAEGGALAVPDADLKHRIDLLKNFGIKNEEEVVMPGINGKMNELQAALGLCMLEEVAAETARRAAIAAIYRERLSALPGIRTLQMPDGVTDSGQYFVIRVNAGEAGTDRDTLHRRLKEFNIVCRKYFYPLCSDYGCYRHLPSADPARLPHAQRAAREVMTLPYFGALGDDEVHRICDAIAYCLATGGSA